MTPCFQATDLLSNTPPARRREEHVTDAKAGTALPRIVAKAERGLKLSRFSWPVDTSFVCINAQREIRWQTTNDRLKGDIHTLNRIGYSVGRGMPWSGDLLTILPG